MSAVDREPDTKPRAKHWPIIMITCALVVVAMWWSGVVPLWVGLLGLCVFIVEMLPVPPLPWHAKVGWGTVVGTFLLLGLWQWVPVYGLVAAAVGFLAYKAYLFRIRWKQRAEMETMWSNIKAGKKSRG